MYMYWPLAPFGIRLFISPTWYQSEVRLLPHAATPCSVLHPSRPSPCRPPCSPSPARARALLPRLRALLLQLEPVQAASSSTRRPSPLRHGAPPPQPVQAPPARSSSGSRPRLLSDAFRARRAAGSSPSSLLCRRGACSPRRRSPGRRARLRRRSSGCYPGRHPSPGRSPLAACPGRCCR